MGERRDSRRRGSGGDGTKRAADRRRRSALTEEEVAGPVDEETMDSGRASDVDEQQGMRTVLGKRSRRDVVGEKGEVHTTAPHQFYRKVLLGLMSNPLCEEFLSPVLEVYTDKQVPGYRERVKKPMDLGTVKEKLAEGIYTRAGGGGWVFDSDACARDLRLIFENCILYNDPKSGLHRVAHELLQEVDAEIRKWEAGVAREREMKKKQESAVKKAKRDNERKRRKLAEEEAANAAAQAKRAAMQVEKLKRDVEDAARRREQEVRRKEHDMRLQMEREKQTAVNEAVQEALLKAKRESRSGRPAHTSSVSSDENEGGVGEVAFMFVSTEGMEKKRGRKSAVVMELESRHDECTKRRRTMVDTAAELERMKQIEMTFAEKRAVCEQVAELDFVRMKAVADIIARGMQRPDILNAVDIDIDVDHIENWVMREVQFFLSSPVAMTAKNALRLIEKEITEIEQKLVGIRYYPVEQTGKK